MTSAHVYGWKRDLPDFRDHPYAALRLRTGPLPAMVDLRPHCPPVYDQGPLGACTAHAIAAAHQFDQIKEGEQDFLPSRLAIYYNERLKEHSIPDDSGAQLRTGVQVVSTIGAAPETLWPYDPSQFAVRPPPAVYAEAAKHRVLSYQSVPRALAQMKACLAEGFPFVFGFSVYESFESDLVATTGVVPLPGGDESFLGGHAVACVGYDDAKGRFTVRNSWGDSWGLQGYCTMPYAYLLDAGLASDFWTLRRVA